MEVQLTYTSFHMQIYSQNRGNEFTGGGMAAKENNGDKTPFSIIVNCNVTVLAQYSDYLEFAFLLHGISFTFFYLVQV